MKIQLMCNVRLMLNTMQVTGRFVEYEGLTLLTVRGGGHDVPQDKPAEALVLISSFLSDRKLPTENN